MRRIALIKSIFLLVFFVVLLVGVAEARAATMTFYPSNGSMNVGGGLSATVFVNSADQAMNAAAGTISFPTDKLEVTSISKSGTIFSLWVREPSYSNTAGTINFEGIVLNPGFTGSGGKILTINFKAKSAGTANVVFSSGSILANDGQGTNIISGLGSASYGINIPAVGDQPPKSTTPSSQPGVPLAPKVTSETHPDPENWYNSSEAIFNWEMPQGVNGVNILADQNPNSNPGSRSEGVFSSHTYSDVEDGTWYFHVRSRNSNGWGSITHYKFQIDTEAPTFFNIKEIERTDLSEPQVSFEFTANDETSGINHYEINIDGGEPIFWQDDGSHIFRTSILPPGEHILIAKAVDFADNELASSANFVVEPIATPIITEYPPELTGGDFLVVKGTAVPNIRVYLWIKSSNGDPVQQSGYSDEQGNFTVIYENKLDNGLYKIWLEAIDERGARSNPTEELTIVVQPSAFVKFGSWVLSWLTVLVSLLALLIILALLIWYIWHRIMLFKKKLRKEVKETERDVHQALEELRKNMRHNINVLKMTNTKGDHGRINKKLIKQLNKDVDSMAYEVEKYVSKEIQDIEREVQKGSLIRKNSNKKK